MSRHRLAIFLALVAAMTALATRDWSKPPAAQASAQLYRRAIFDGYYRFVRPTTSHFVHCRFHPTCSVYSLVAVQTYGFPKGIWLTVKRLARCQPSVRPGTDDPVPPRTAPALVATTR